MKKVKKIKLDCGIETDSWLNGANERLRISLINLYDGFGDENDLLLMSKLFAELHEKGFKPIGMSLEKGRYYNIDNIFLDVVKYN